jgi:hypothetical protein
MSDALLVPAQSLHWNERSWRAERQGNGSCGSGGLIADLKKGLAKRMLRCRGLGHAPLRRRKPSSSRPHFR